MDNYSMIERLKAVGITFEPGVSERELGEIQYVFGIHFPQEIRSFLCCGLPVGDGFFNWRDLSDSNLRRFHSFYDNMAEKFRFDLEKNGLSKMLGAPYDRIDDMAQLQPAVMDYVSRSPKLVPFYAHRCFFDGMDDMPIISFWQPVDTVFYGGTFANYLEVEFFGKPPILETVPRRMENTGIWRDIILEI